MQVRPEQLSNHLRKQLAPIYWISGDETLIVEESVETLRKHCREQGFADRQVHEADKQFDWQNIVAAASEMSLFSDRKIIELRIPSGKPGDSGSKALQAYAEIAPEDNVLIISSPKLDGKATKSKWYKSLTKTGVHVPVWPVAEHQLGGWIQQRLQRAGMSADHDAVELLADRVQGNLLAAAQEVEKLQMLGLDRIDVDTVQQAVADNARFDLFGFIDAAVGGRPEAVRMLSGLRAEGVEVAVISWAFAREVRQMLQIAEQVQQGVPFEQAARKMRVFDKRIPMVRKAMNRLKSRGLKALLAQCYELDQGVKGMAKIAVWDSLADITLQISGIKPVASQL